MSRRYGEFGQGAVWPKITIVTPSFNQGDFIAATIESVLGQDYPNLEYIIVDGGSTDATLDILQGYSERLAWWVSEPDHGQSHALNKGFSRATGEILCWLNSDDQLAPDALKAVALAFQTYRPDLVAGICEVFDQGGLIHRHLTSCGDGPLPLQHLLDLERGWNAGQFFYQPEVFFSRDLWLRAGAHVREDVHFSMDYELWCRFALQGARLKVLGMPLAHFRSHVGQKTHDIGGFKAELGLVRDQFCQSFGVPVPSSARPRVDWSRKLKVALVNDLGFLYGAGIAHWRLAAAMDLAGWAVRSFPLSRSGDGDGDWQKLLQSIRRFGPDMVLLGNFHAVEKRSLEPLAVLEAEWPCFWVTHDFWLLTGRCAYMGECRKFLDQCDRSCPSADQYPSLPPEDIGPAFTSKRRILQNTRQLHLLANSQWASEQARMALDSMPADQISVHRMTLGAPVELFHPSSRQAARAAWGIAAHEVCLAFSSSSIADPRKGSELLASALARLEIENLVVLLVGRVDQKVQIPGARLVYTGYLNDQAGIAQALSAADLYVAASQEETFGQVFIEAALVGTPSVGFAVSGITDAIVDGVTGFLITEPSAQGLADGLSALLADPDRLRQVGQTAAIQARAQFSLEACFHSLFRALDDAGLVDRAGLAHKIAFADRSALVACPQLAEQQPGWRQRLLYLPRRLAQRLLGLLPQDFKDRCRDRLPAWLDRWLVRFIFGPAG